MAPCLCACVCSYKASLLAFLAIAILSLLLGCGFLFTKQPAIAHSDQRGHSAYHIPGLAVHVLQEHGVLLPAHDNGKVLAHPVAAATSTLLQLEGVSKEGAALLDNAPQEENAFDLLDDGKQQSAAPKEEIKVDGRVSKEGAALFDNVPQKEYAFLVDEQSTSTVSQEGAALFDNVPQKENAFLVDDGKQQSTSTVSEEGAALFDNVPQKENAFLVDDGKQQSAPEGEIKLVSVLSKEGASALSDNAPQEENAFLLEDGKQQSAPEEEIKLPLIPPQSKMKMVGSNDHDLQEAAANPYELSMPKIRMVGTSQRRPIILQKLQNPRAGAGRSRSCTSNPNVCQDPRIALYGLQGPTPRPGPERPSCCDGVCVDLSTNPAHCGSCGRQCSLMEACCNGQCTDLSKDDSNCGHCGHSCPPCSPCQFGMCGYY